MYVYIIYKFTLEMDRKGGTSLNCRVLICAGLVEIRAFFWYSWVDLHGVYSTFMFFSTFWDLYELTLFPRWKTDCEVWHASYSSLLSDFPCKPTCPNVKSYKLLEKEKSVASRACWKLLRLEKYTIATSRACWKLLRLEKDTIATSRVCWKLLEKAKSVASKVCWKSIEKK